jgi:hypothetical protein
MAQKRFDFKEMQIIYTLSSRLFSDARPQYQYVFENQRPTLASLEIASAQFSVEKLISFRRNFACVADTVVSSNIGSWLNPNVDVALDLSRTQHLEIEATKRRLFFCSRAATSRGCDPYLKKTYTRIACTRNPGMRGPWSYSPSNDA